MEILPKLLVVVLIVAGLWLALQPRYLFFVRIRDGVPRLRRGQVTQAFLDCIREACERNGVGRGWVGGVRRGKRVALVFSRDIPPGCQQQLRNEWLLTR